jgi:hypothetical protein
MLLQVGNRSPAGSSQEVHVLATALGNPNKATANNTLHSSEDISRQFGFILPDNRIKRPGSEDSCVDKRVRNHSSVRSKLEKMWTQ